MKKINLRFILFVIIVSFISFNPIFSQEKTDENKTIDLNEYIGSRLYKVFNDIGLPNDVVCSADGGSGVILNYDIFGIQIDDKIVSVIYFWDNFPGEVFGNKIGTTKKELEEKYGKPDSEKKSSVDGSDVWIYNLKDTDRYFVLIFDENSKVKRIQIELMK